MEFFLITTGLNTVVFSKLMNLKMKTKFASFWYKNYKYKAVQTKCN